MPLLVSWLVCWAHLPSALGLRELLTAAAAVCSQRVLMELMGHDQGRRLSVRARILSIPTPAWFFPALLTCPCFVSQGDLVLSEAPAEVGKDLWVPRRLSLELGVWSFQHTPATLDQSGG